MILVLYSRHEAILDTFSVSPNAHPKDERTHRERHLDFELTNILERSSLVTVPRQSRIHLSVSPEIDWACICRSSFLPHVLQP